MNAFYQRLKELDAKTFEQFCFHLLKEQHPGVDIRHVEGAGGDEGIDSFTGEIEGNLFVWQCKSFPNGIGDSQRRQIRESLNRAVANPHVRGWVLCLSIDLNTNAHRWFQELKQSYNQRLHIGLMDASQIVHELMHRRTLRDAYFPGAAIEVGELRSLLLKTGELSDHELATLTTENVGQYQQRLRDRDSRFAYEITFGGDLGTPPRAPRPGLIMSMTDQDKTVDVFARDVDALKLSPPKFKFSVKGSAAEKMMELIRTGRKQEFGPGEITNFHTDFAFLAGIGNDSPVEPLMMQVGPSAASQSMPLRVTFGVGSEAVVYEWMEFKVVRAGTEELELMGGGGGPFRLRLILGPTQNPGTVTIEMVFVNSEVRSIQKIMRAMRVATTAKYFELYDLRQGKHIVRGNLFNVPEWDPKLQRLVDDAVLVADRYRVELRLPAEVTDADAENLIWLRDLANGDLRSAGDFSMTVVKGTENEPALLQLFAGSGVAVRLAHGEYEPTPQLFGVKVATGPIVAEALTATLKDCDQSREAFQKANVGDDVELIFNHCEEMRFKLLSVESISK